jgi:hypothetical protein
MDSKSKAITVAIVIIVIIVILIPLAFGGAIFNDNPGNPEAKIVAEKTVASINEDIQFDGSDSKGDIILWLWDFDDGEVSIECSPNHTFAKSKFYRVVLMVKDKDGNTDIAIQNISIHNVGFHVERSGNNLNGIGRGWSWDVEFFTILSGTTKPIIYANWSGSATMAEIIMDIESPSALLFRQTEDVLNSGFTFSAVIASTDIEEFGEFSIWLGCGRGMVDNYFMEVDVCY